MTQEEADAVAEIIRRPYYPGQDADLLRTVLEFMSWYRSCHVELEPSDKAVALMERCFMTGDYRKLDNRISHSRRIIEKMIERATVPG